SRTSGDYWRVTWSPIGTMPGRHRRSGDKLHPYEGCTHGLPLWNPAWRHEDALQGGCITRFWGESTQSAALPLSAARVVSSGGWVYVHPGRGDRVPRVRGAGSLHSRG